MRSQERCDADALRLWLVPGRVSTMPLSSASDSARGRRALPGALPGALAGVLARQGLDDAGPPMLEVVYGLRSVLAAKSADPLYAAALGTP